jgi:hypothetical protein
MKTILFTVPGCQPMIGNVISEDNKDIVIEYPVLLLKEELTVYTMPYMPFAKNGLVSFNKDNVISVSAVEEEVLEFYSKVLEELKSEKVIVKKPSSKKINEIKLKHLH